MLQTGKEGTTTVHLKISGEGVEQSWQLQLASRAVAKRSGLMHGQLFLIKQLLILREQIAPFEADFSHVEKDLDFSHMRSHLRRILAGAALSPLFTN